MYKLRDNQQDSMFNIEAFLNGPEKSTIVVAPVAFGKSICIANTAILIDSPIVVIQSSKELLIQNYKKYTSYGFEAQIFSSSLKSRKIGKVTFATIGSIVKYAQYFKEIGVKHVIVDECDYAPKSSNQIGIFCKAINAKKIIGFTATPLYLVNGKNGNSLKMLTDVRSSVFKSICHVTQCKEMVDKGYWTPIDYRHVDVNTSMLKLNSTGNDYTSETLRQFIQDNDITKHVIYFCERMKKAESILVFVDSIDYAEELCKILPNSVAIHSKLSSDERDEKVNGFKSRKYRIAINVGVLAVGFDFPELQVIIHARPTNSIRIWYQTIGRVVRLAEGKDICLVVDLSGNLAKFGKIEDLVYEYHPAYGWILKNHRQILSTNSIIEADAVKRISRLAIGDYQIPFGKFKGKSLKFLFFEDKRYLTWLASDQFVPHFASGVECKSKVKDFLNIA